MKYVRPEALLITILGLFLVACEDEPVSSDIAESTDSTVVAEEVTRGLETSAIRPELVGKWKLVDMRMDNEPLPQTIPGNSFLEFLTDGSVALFSEGFEPDTASIKQNGDLLMSDIWDSAQRLDSLTMGRLILSENLDGTEISYIYSKE